MSYDCVFLNKIVLLFNTMYDCLEKNRNAIVQKLSSKYTFLMQWPINCHRNVKPFLKQENRIRLGVNQNEVNLVL